MAVVLDLGSRRVVGWSMSSTMRDDLVIAALDVALADRQPNSGTIFHSDRGSQYASEDFRAVANRHGLTLSMSAKGDCRDNAVVESFFGTLKSELGDPVWADARFSTCSYFQIHRRLVQLQTSSFDARLRQPNPIRVVAADCSVVHCPGNRGRLSPIVGQ